MSLNLMMKSLLRRKVVTMLLIVQLAMTLALLMNSLILADQTHTKLNSPTGLDLTQTLHVALKPTTTDLRAYPLLGDLLERQLAAVRTLSGVQAVAYTNQAPLRRGGNQGNVYDPEAEERTNLPNIPMYVVSPDFFVALDLKLVEGELPTTPIEADGRTTSPVVLTRSLAEKLFPGRSAIGLQTSRAPVAAVVEDFFGHTEVEPHTYNLMHVAPLWSVDWGYGLLIRTNASSIEQIRQQLPEVLRRVEPNIEIFYVRTLEEQYHLLYRNEFGLATLLTLLSALMLLVTMVSSYSHAHFHVLKQQQEIGIKRALGASQRTILVELFCETWLTTLLGAALGLLAAQGGNQLLAQVISIPALNLWYPLVATLVLLLCVTLATWYPARIATQVSPATATKTL